MQYSATPFRRFSSCQTLSSTCTAAISAMRRASSIWPTLTLQSPIALDEPVALQRGERPHAGGERRARIGRVELIELDALDAERAPARFARGKRDDCARPSGTHCPCGRVSPPLVATTMRERSPLQVASARAISRSLWPTSQSSRQ